MSNPINTINRGEKVREASSSPSPSPSSPSASSSSSSVSSSSSSSTSAASSSAATSRSPSAASSSTSPPPPPPAQPAASRRKLPVPAQPSQISSKVDSTSDPTRTLADDPLFLSTRQRVRKTDRRVNVQTQIRAAKAAAEDPAVKKRGDEYYLDVETSLLSRLDALTERIMAAEEAAATTPLQRRTDDQTCTHTTHASFAVWLDGFKTAVDAVNPFVHPQQLFRGLEAGWVTGHGAPTTSSSTSGNTHRPSSFCATPPVLLLDCTYEFCRRRAWRALVSEIDAAYAETMAVVSDRRRKSATLRSQLRKAKMAHDAKKEQEKKAVPSSSSSSSPSSSPSTPVQRAHVLKKNAGAMDTQPTGPLPRSRAGGKKQKRKRVNSDDDDEATATTTPDEESGSPESPSNPRHVLFETQLQATREQLAQSNAEMAVLRRQRDFVHRGQRLSTPETCLETLSADRLGMPDTRHTHDVPDGCMLLLPHPHTGLVELTPGHHYCLVKFVGAHLVLAGRWEAIPLVVMTHDDGASPTSTMHEVTAPPQPEPARTLLTLAPTWPNAAAVPPRDPTLPSSAAGQSDSVQNWARRELAAVLLFLQENAERTAGDFFELVPEEAAIYMTAAAEKGWSAS